MVAAIRAFEGSPFSVMATALIFGHAIDGRFGPCNAMQATRCARWAIGWTAKSLAHKRSPEQRRPERLQSPATRL